MKKHFIGKIFCLIMAVALALGITACTDGGKKPEKGTTYTVTFDVQNHGTAPEAQPVKEGGYATEPEKPAESGWKFIGWYKEADCENKYSFATETVTADITLYAKWRAYNGVTLPTDKTPTIYLAGDSTVKTYNESQWIGGWGQYLNYFLSDDVTVVNAANGGRSSRSFINEGRLYNIENNTYSFSENNRQSIEDVIEEGDFLFIQFGHNDDDTNKGTYSTLYDRMVPLGTPDSNGIYPVTAPSDEAKMANDYLPQEYLNNVNDDEKVATAYATIQKYGDTYFSYDCGGTYKWYLKQYIDFAREKGAIPVLVTPVARVAFNNDGTLRDGAGRHGDNFAYVQAVRQLAEEEDCLLVDNFAYTKDLIEKATKDYADFLMALVPNDLTGAWPTGYDNAYNNVDAGFQKIEATHYNKYGAYLTAAYVADSIISSTYGNDTHKNDSEYFTFADYVLETPSTYIDPSNRISKAKVSVLEGLYTYVNPTNPDRTYPDPAEVVAKINEVCTGTVTGDNYLEYQEKCDEALALYNGLNYDDRSAVTNYNKLKQYIAAVDAQIEAHRPVATSTVVFNASSVATGDITSTVTSGDFKIVGTDSKAISVKATSTTFEVNGKSITTSNGISMGGAATFGSSRYIEFTTTKACTVTVVAKSSGNDDRTVNLVSATNTGTVLKTFEANAGVSVTSQNLTAAGTYQIGSAGSGIWIFYILIEYFD